MYKHSVQQIMQQKVQQNMQRKVQQKVICVYQVSGISNLSAKSLNTHLRM